MKHFLIHIQWQRLILIPLLGTISAIILLTTKAYKILTLCSSWDFHLVDGTSGIKVEYINNKYL